MLLELGSCGLSVCYLGIPVKVLRKKRACLLLGFADSVGRGTNGSLFC